MRLLSALAVLGFLGMATAGDDKPKTGFVNKTHKNADGSESPYVVFVPHDYDGKTPVPVILFLHGAGETKGGKKMPVQQGHRPGTSRTAARRRSRPSSSSRRPEKRTWRADGPTTASARWPCSTRS